MTTQQLQDRHHNKCKVFYCMYFQVQYILAQMEDKKGFYGNSLRDTKLCHLPSFLKYSAFEVIWMKPISNFKISNL